MYQCVSRHLSVLPTTLPRLLLRSQSGRKEKENISAWVICKRRNLLQDALNCAHLLLYLCLLMIGTRELLCPCNDLRGGCDVRGGLHIIAFNYAGISNAVLPGYSIVVGENRTRTSAVWPLQIQRRVEDRAFPTYRAPARGHVC
jgi:hypothetical protein